MLPGQVMAELEYMADIVRSHMNECSTAHKASQGTPGKSS